MTEDREDLLDAVDDLTLVQHAREKQERLVDGKTHVQVTIVTQPPLLTQLDDAIRSNMGGSTSGATLAYERAALDVDALFKFIQIETQIKDWCRAFKAPVTRDPVADLRAWYTATLATVLEPAVEKFYLTKMRGWAGTIRGKLDPWREKDLPDACPSCGARTWWRDGAEYYRPLVIRYKPDGPDMLTEARAVCRSCEQVWPVRALAYELEQAEVSSD